MTISNENGRTIIEIEGRLFNFPLMTDDMITEIQNIEAKLVADIINGNKKEVSKKLESIFKGE